MSSKPPNSNHRPQQEDRKQPGGNYGGPRRVELDAQDTVEPSPVQRALQNPDNQPDSWRMRMNGRAAINDRRVNGGGMGK